MIPEINKIYYFFDDGKIRESRKDEVLITAVIPFDEIDIKTLSIWEIECEQCKHLYDTKTDYFVKGVLKKGKQELIFSRSHEGWFSFGNYLWDGRLDIDGTLNNKLKQQG